eukprot:363836-Chlamydomonas_euryale.AAC.3
MKHASAEAACAAQALPPPIVPLSVSCNTEAQQSYNDARSHRCYTAPAESAGTKQVEGANVCASELWRRSLRQLIRSDKVPRLNDRMQTGLPHRREGG